METFANYIDGSWTPAADRMAAVNPATGEPIAWLPRSAREPAREAIAAATRAAPGWAKQPVWKRAEACAKVAAVLGERRDASARVLSQEQGKPLAQAVGEVAK